MKEYVYFRSCVEIRHTEQERQGACCLLLPSTQPHADDEKKRGLLPSRWFRRVQNIKISHHTQIIELTRKSLVLITPLKDVVERRRVLTKVYRISSARPAIPERAWVTLERSARLLTLLIPFIPFILTSFLAPVIDSPSTVFNPSAFWSS